MTTQHYYGCGMEEFMYLEKIQSPEDVKKLDVEQLKVLAGEMRQALIQKLSVHGGHVGPNLGMVEPLPCTMYLIHQRIRWCLMYHIRVTAIKC